MEFAIAHHDLHSSRRYALRRAPTRGAPARLFSLGVMPWGGRPQGAPLPIVFSRRNALGRAPIRGAPTELSSLGVMPWGGHPQGAPLPFVFSGRYALGRAPTRGAPTICLLWALCPGEGAHKGRPYLWALCLRRAPTRGAPTDCLLWALCPGEGTHKGRPYQLSSLGVMPWGGRPQGAPLPIVFSGRYALGRAPTRGASTNCLLSALCPGEGTHKGRLYQLSSLGVMP